jgi:hypothetical protein
MAGRSSAVVTNWLSKILGFREPDLNYLRIMSKSGAEDTNSAVRRDRHGERRQPDDKTPEMAFGICDPEAFAEHRAHARGQPLGLPAAARGWQPSSISASPQRGGQRWSITGWRNRAQF